MVQKIDFQSLYYIGFLSFRGWTIRGLRGCGTRDPWTRLARDGTGQCLHMRFEECIALFFEALEQRQAIFHVTFVQVLEVLRMLVINSLAFLIELVQNSHAFLLELVKNNGV